MLYDIKKYLWYLTSVFSAIFLIFKIVMYTLLFSETSWSVGLMSAWNFEGCEIYFWVVNEHEIEVGWMEYLKAFVPNTLVLVFSVVTILMQRVNNKVNLECLCEQVNKKAYKFYLVLVWVLLIVLISSGDSVQGYALFLFQLLLTLKIFLRNPLRTEMAIIQWLKYYLYLILATSFLFSTPLGVEYQQDNQYLSDFLGLPLFTNVMQQQWQVVLRSPIH